MDDAKYFWHVVMDVPPAATDVVRFIGLLPISSSYRGVRWRRLDTRLRMPGTRILDSLIEGLTACGDAPVSVDLYADALKLHMARDEFGQYRVRVYSVDLIKPDPPDFWTTNAGFLGASLGAYCDYVDYLEQGIGVDGVPWTGRGGWPLFSDHSAASIWCVPDHPMQAVAEQSEFVKSPVGASGIDRIDLFELGGSPARVNEQKQKYIEIMRPI